MATRAGPLRIVVVKNQTLAWPEALPVLRVDELDDVDGLDDQALRILGINGRSLITSRRKYLADRLAASLTGSAKGELDVPSLTLGGRSPQPPTEPPRSSRRSKRP